MNKKVLIVASVVSFIEWFNKENIEYLIKERNCDLHIACNFDYMEDTDVSRTKEYIIKLQKDGVKLHNIAFARSPFSLENVNAYRKLKKLIEGNAFDLVHCHTPTVSILTRLASRHVRKRGSIVMYTCHGFHFHRASSKLNWIIYYPVERLMSYYTDYLITINNEDFCRAKKFACKNVRYIPGVGVDLKKIRDCNIDKNQYKKSLGLPDNAIMILSLGELIKRKNHEIIIRALTKVSNKNVYYVIAGKGPLKDYLKQIALENGLNDRVVFLGFRTDVAELCNTADISAFPSRIEGLGIAGIEAMAAGVPLISSNVHGILDYVKDGMTGYTCAPDDVDKFAIAIETLVSDKSLRDSMAKNCIEAVKPFDLECALSAMWNIYDEVLK